MCPNNFTKGRSNSSLK